MKYFTAVYKAWKIKLMVLPFLIPILRFIFGMFIVNIHQNVVMFILDIIGNLAEAQIEQASSKQFV